MPLLTDNHAFTKIMIKFLVYELAVDLWANIIAMEYDAEYPFQHI